MFRLILSLMFFAGALGLNAQVPAPGHPFPDASIRTRSSVETLVQIGGRLQERTFPNPESSTRSPWLEPHMSQTPNRSRAVQNPLESMRSFTVEPWSSTEYGVRNNSNPFENYTIRLQPWNGFSIQDNLSVTGRSYTVHPEPFGGFSVHNTFNPSESFRTLSNPFEPFGSTQPFGRYGVRDNFGLPNIPDHPQSPFSSPSVRDNFPQPFKRP